MIPLLTRIDRELSTCTDPLQRAELLAERACYLARIGDFAGANAIAASLREVYGDGRSTRVSVWIMLLEGLILFFDQIDDGARDRLVRAHFVSESAGAIDLTSLTASWLAHIEFNRSNFPAAAQMLRKCALKSMGKPTQWSARVCVVLGDAYMHCGQPSQARRWYDRARSCAVALGDEATIAAIIFNRAALGLAQLRIGDAIGQVDPETLRFVSLEIDSARNYHLGTGHTSLLQLVDACQARIALLEGKFEKALHLLESLLRNAQLPIGFHSDRLILQVEHAQCLHELNSDVAAREIFCSIEAVGYSKMTLDDQLIFATSYVRLGTQLGLESMIDSYAELIPQSRALYLSEISGLRRICDGVSAEIVFE